MFRIRKFYDDKSILNQNALAQIKEIMGEQFELISTEEIEKIGKQLVDPVYYQFRSSIFVVEGHAGKVKAFAILLHFSDLDLCYLEWISISVHNAGRGIGGILYEAIREECKLLKAKHLLMEVLPDEEKLCPYPVSLEQNRKRIKFYEKYGARVILNKNFEKTYKDEQNDLLFLIQDPLDQENVEIPKKKMHQYIEAILKRKYKGLCSPEYIENVLASFSDNPTRFREPKYTSANKDLAKNISPKKTVPLFINRSHDIHHIKERGYVEAPSRVGVIFKEISKMGVFQELTPKRLPEALLLKVHDKSYIEFLKKITKVLGEKEVYYPEIFPLRNRTRLPKDIKIQAGYYCLDSFTPLHHNVFKASYASAECAYTAAIYTMAGHRVTYALCRPPGHHAERELFGGFCYINSAAIAAEYLSQFGKVAILDLDYHHGNGTQSIFYNRSDVLTLSIHCNPHDAYPFFTGFEDEVGIDQGVGFNQNYPLPEKINIELYERTLTKVLKKISDFQADYLVISLGLDLAKGDPTGTWIFTPEDFRRVGLTFKNFKLPITVIQEGGYHQKDLGKFARGFFDGMLGS